ncbi:MAG: winged helix-turn-helix domain-containing protein [Candidatus Bathyarchaeota archaeon]
MSKYRRSKIELYVDILRAICNGRKSPSRMVYAANLSYDRVIRCVNFLEEQGLVEKIDENKKGYAITERGKAIVQYFEEIETSLFYKKKTFSNINVHYNRLTTLGEQQNEQMNSPP